MSHSEIPIFSWWSAARKDNFATTDRRWAAGPGTTFDTHDGYTAYGVEGKLFSPDHPQPDGTVRVSSFYSPGRGDNFLTTDPRHTSVDTIAPDYRYSRHEGYLYDPRRPQPPGTVAIFSWWNAERGDNFATSNPEWSMPVDDIIWNGEHVANGPIRGGYRLYRLEGFAGTFDMDTLEDFLPPRMKVSYKLEIVVREDTNYDDPRLDLVIASFGGYRQVDVYTTGTLANNSGPAFGRGGVIETLPGEYTTYRGCFDIEHPVNGADPHLALAIRAVDEDNSSARNREKDIKYFKDGIENELNNVVAGDAVLTETSLQTAASEQLIDRSWRDDDDRIGVAVAVINDCYAQAISVCAGEPLGEDEGLRDEFEGSLPHILFHSEYSLLGDGAHYNLGVVISVDDFR